jgi:hypothetical protein
LFKDYFNIPIQNQISSGHPFFIQFLQNALLERNSIKVSHPSYTQRKLGLEIVIEFRFNTYTLAYVVFSLVVIFTASSRGPMLASQSQARLEEDDVGKTLRRVATLYKKFQIFLIQIKTIYFKKYLSEGDKITTISFQIVFIFLILKI